MATAYCCASGKITDSALLVEQGALYSRLVSLGPPGTAKASWGVSDNNRKAKFYELTAAGRKRFREEPKVGIAWPQP